MANGQVSWAGTDAFGTSNPLDQLATLVAMNLDFQVE
jgi:hypothetical protein